MATINFDRVALFGDHNQQKIVEIQRALGAKVRIEFDQQNGTFYLESRSPQLTTRQGVANFDLIFARRYFGDYVQRFLAVNAPMC